MTLSSDAAESAASRRNRQDDDAEAPGAGGASAQRLLARAEAIAAERGRTLLNLDTASEEGASGFYERNGYPSPAKSRIMR